MHIFSISAYSVSMVVTIGEHYCQGRNVQEWHFGGNGQRPLLGLKTVSRFEDLKILWEQ